MEHINLSLKWLESGFIFAPSAPEKSLYTLQNMQKYSILKSVFKEPSIDKATKMALLEKTLGDDKSDIATNTRECCLAAIPEPENKERVWKELTEPGSK